MFPYLVSGFGKNVLSNLVKECFGADFPDIIKKKQVNYIYNYLKDLDAKSVVLEVEYVDKDYLEDYSRYYVKCFNRYGERCARLHFFTEEIKHSDLDAVLEEPKSYSEVLKKIKDSYLGFIVVKPIPKTFIGKTCLKVYKAFEEDSSRFLITKEYDVGFFGIDLSVKSVAFQEQDKVLSACATTAIWCSLHALKKRNVRDIPSSSEITLAAINHINNSSNSFPNDGLTNKQILRALDVEKLRHHLVNVGVFNEVTKNYVFKIIKTYINSNIPVILGSDVYENKNGELRRLDGHAVTILGYQYLGEDKETVLYLHDDRIGPFARARIGRVSDFIPDIKTNSDDIDWCIALQEKNDNGDWLPVDQVLVPDSLIIPTDKKVRIPAEYVENTCSSIVDEYESYLDDISEEGKDFSGFKDFLTYDIVMDELSDVRNRIFNDDGVKNRRAILTKSSARFLWAAKFYYQKKLVFEILFDATDIPQGSIVSNIIIYDETYYEVLIAPFTRLIDSGFVLPESDDLNFLGAFISFLKTNDGDLFDYLDRQYGEPRAPLYLKEEEVDGNQLQNQLDIKKHYGMVDKSLEDDFSSVSDEKGSFMIWAIAYDGALLIGEEHGNKGHPTLTGFKPARIAGELRRDAEGWYINSKSGRYSSSYPEVNMLLRNAKDKFHEIYSKQKVKIRVLEYKG